MLTYAAKALCLVVLLQLYFNKSDILRRFQPTIASIKKLTHPSIEIRNSSFENVLDDATDEEKKLLIEYGAYHPRYKALVKNLR